MLEHLGILADWLAKRIVDCPGFCALKDARLLK